MIHCPCGADVTGETDDELVAAVEQHVQRSTRIGLARWAARRSSEQPKRAKFKEATQCRSRNWAPLTNFGPDGGVRVARVHGLA